VIARLDKMRSNFLWKGKNEVAASACLVNWEQVHVSKKQGGLGY